ncbi:MAG: hypothetical protein ACJ796_14195 [Gemmatimonadaceae bacterium]
MTNFDSELEALLRAQRDALSSSSAKSHAPPQVGDIWISHTQWSFGAEEGLAAMLVVLRAFNEAWSSQPLFDVAPISEDERLATEWSLILSASDSGLGVPLVLHIDVQSTTTSSMLARRLGSLAEHARDDLLNVLRAYALSDASAIELRVGRSGTVSIRFHPEWDEFAKQLVSLSQAFAAPLEEERCKTDPGNDSSDIEDNADERLLAAASGAESASSFKEHCNWEYRTIRPFIYCIGAPVSRTPQRLGEAVACYYSGGKTIGVQRTAQQWLDSATFHRIEPFFDLPLKRFFEYADALMAFHNVVGPSVLKSLPASDIKLIVESIRCAKLATGLTAGTKPMKLAARRPTDE